MNIAVTGSKGFIGTYLCKELKKKKIEFIELDYSNGYDISKINTLDKIKKFDILIHLAAKTFIPSSLNNSYDFFYNNIISTLNVLELCKKFNSKIIFPSTYVYGAPKYLPINENHPINVSNTYTHSKLICEELCKSYNRDSSIDVKILRLFNVYGKNQNKNFLIPTIINQLKNDKIIFKRFFTN